MEEQPGNDEIEAAEEEATAPAPAPAEAAATAEDAPPVEAAPEETPAAPPEPAVDCPVPFEEVPAVHLYPGSMVGDTGYSIVSPLTTLGGVRAWVADGPNDESFLVLARPHVEDWEPAALAALKDQPGFAGFREALVEGAADAAVYVIKDRSLRRLVDQVHPADDDALIDALMTELDVAASLVAAGCDLSTLEADSFAYIGDSKALRYFGVPSLGAVSPEPLRKLLNYTATRCFARNTTQKLADNPFDYLPFSVELKAWLNRAHQQLSDAAADLPSVVAELRRELAPLGGGRRSRFEAVCKTDVGMRRTLNEDAVGVFTVNCCFEADQLRYDLLVLCDGMGGHDGGEVASRLTVRRMLHKVEEKIDALAAQGKRVSLHDNVLMRRVLLEAIVAVNAEVVALASGEGFRGGKDKPGTTLCFVFQFERTAYFGWVGDSRGYILRNGKLERVTRDHSVNQQRIDRGEITEDEAFNNEDSNVILSNIGAPTLRLYDVEIRYLHDGDRVILCTDGICGVLRDAQILETATGSQSLIEMCARLIDGANKSGGPDNSSVIAAQIELQNNRRMDV